MDENQRPSVAILPNGHPSFLFVAVLLVKEGDGQWIQEELGSISKLILCLRRFSFALTGSHSKV